MKFVPQLCRNRLENVTNFSKAILLLFVVHVDELHGKLEKLKKKVLNHQKQESKKKEGCVGKITERYLSGIQHWQFQNSFKHLRWSLLAE